MKNHPLATKEVVAMILIALLVIVAMLMGINGYLYFAGVAAIAGLGGYVGGRAIEAHKKPPKK
jgi:small-conductance mechanosensitive channel